MNKVCLTHRCSFRYDISAMAAVQDRRKRKIILCFSDSSASRVSEANGREETKRKRIISHRDRRERRGKKENSIMVFSASPGILSEVPLTGQARVRKLKKTSLMQRPRLSARPRPVGDYALEGRVYSSERPTPRWGNTEDNKN